MPAFLSVLLDVYLLQSDLTSTTSEDPVYKLASVTRGTLHLASETAAPAITFVITMGIRPG